MKNATNRGYNPAAETGKPTAQGELQGGAARTAAYFGSSKAFASIFGSRVNSLYVSVAKSVVDHLGLTFAHLLRRAQLEIIGIDLRSLVVGVDPVA